MFGKRTVPGTRGNTPAASPPPAATRTQPSIPTGQQGPAARSAFEPQRSDDYYATKRIIFGALVEAIDLSQLSHLDSASARDEIRGIVHEIIALKSIAMSTAEQQDLIDDVCNDVLGYGPLEPLLARDDIADIMVNGAAQIFIEVDGKIQLTNVRFRDNAQLMNICQRIVSQVGRRVDEASPICDARLADGSRVNVIAPPLAIDGPVLTIRKFRKDRLTLDEPSRIDDYHGRICAASKNNPRNGRVFHKCHHPGRKAQGWFPPDYPHHRNNGPRRGRYHHPRYYRLRSHGRRFRGQA